LLEPRILLDTATPVIQEMVDQVTEASYSAYLEAISSFPDRNSYTWNGQLSTDLSQMTFVNQNSSG
jgi:hypothetical protein